MQLSRNRSLIRVFIILTILLSVSSLEATGLYADYTFFFSPADTVHRSIAFRQIDIQRDAGRAAVLSAELALRPSPRLLFRMLVPFPTMKLEDGYEYGIGDGSVRTEVRLSGDSLNASGAFLLGDVRLPMGAKSFRPVAYGSLDGGAGLEFRVKTHFFRFRLASTYTLAGDRVKVGPFIHDNYLTLAFSVETDLPVGAALCFRGFGLLFRGGEKREMYALSLGKTLSGSIEAVVSGALEAGTDEERVFNSQISLSIRYIFPFTAEEKPEPAIPEPGRLPAMEFDEK